MKTDIHVVSYLGHFFLEWEMFPTKTVEETKTHILCSVTFFRKWYRLWDNVEKCCRAGQDTDDNMARAHCVLDRPHTHSHSQNVILTALHFNSGYKNAPQYYVIGTLSVLLNIQNKHLHGSVQHSRFIQ